MAFCSILTLLLCGVGLFPVSLYSQNTQMAEPGVDVTMWCQHNLHGHAFIFWIKQTSNSVPQSVACKNRNSNNCYFFTPNNRTVMSVNDKNASLTITAVDPTDSGLYYCSLLLNDKITFSNTTYL
uniref:Ig-like domain-containing protein n=1 Tax=Electrophorus electricus TaxID=8005 RepID=A0A4W4E4W2_ELEEL